MCGGDFDEVRLTRELTDLETQISAPDFWKDQAVAQRVQQRRRRLEDERSLAESIRKQTEDLAVLFDWARQGEDVTAELAPALERYARDVSGGRNPHDARRESSTARTPSSRSIPGPAAPSRRIGPRC